MSTDTPTPPADTGRKTRVLTLASGSAGAGKSTLAAALAEQAAAHGQTVCVIGLDRQCDVSRLLGYDNPDADEELPTLIDVVDGICTLTEALVPGRHSKTGAILPGLWLVLESGKLDTLSVKLAGVTAREMWLFQLLPELLGRFDIILLDCPGNLDLGTQGALIAGHEIVGCTKSQEKEARGLTALEDKIAALHKNFRFMGMPDALAWVVIGEGVTSVSQGKVYFDIERQVREAYGELVVTPTVRDDVKVPEAYSASLPITLYNPRSDAAAAYVKIGKAMNLYS
ncbi:ParA family protein [Streptomyces sp. NBC_00237]|uniref:ParA family protein n=1 Tax=Streptomyces sp. NBC_00237 TaxID=2975687 RepID=UPI002250F72C|nr:ParA family protein [Streptomyces sp. NBC_00237]MCX5207618.1 ParA family protein [Streptomyces sp. NBC_00237]